MSPLTSTGKAFLTLGEAAEIARCSLATLRRAIAARRLTVIKPNGEMGRTLIRPSDLDNYMQRGTRYAVGEVQPRSEIVDKR